METQSATSDFQDFLERKAAVFKLSGCAAKCATESLKEPRSEKG